MKYVCVKPNKEIIDCDNVINSRNIRKILRESSNIKLIELLYEWDYEDSLIQCYGCLNGKAGNENKHDLPPNGKKIKNGIDNSDIQLLFNDVYIVKKKNKLYENFDTAEYALFYNICFGGFDDCNSNDETSDEDELINNDEMNDFIEDDSLSENDSEYIVNDSDELEYDNFDY